MGLKRCRLLALVELCVGKMAKLGLACTLVVASSMELCVQWADCGDTSYHCRITDVDPKTISTGSDQKLHGHATCDESLTGGSLSMKFEGVAAVPFLDCAV